MVEKFRGGAEHAQWKAPETSVHEIYEQNAKPKPSKVEKSTQTTADSKAPHEIYNAAAKPEDSASAHDIFQENAQPKPYKTERSTDTGPDSRAPHEIYEAAAKPIEESEATRADESQPEWMRNAVDANGGRGEEAWKKHDGLDGRRLMNEKGFTTMNNEHDRALADNAEFDRNAQTAERTPNQVRGAERINRFAQGAKKLFEKARNLWSGVKERAGRIVDSLVGTPNLGAEQKARGIEATATAARESMERKCQNTADAAVERASQASERAHEARTVTVDDIKDAYCQAIGRYWLRRANNLEPGIARGEADFRNAEQKLADLVARREGLARESQRLRDLIAEKTGQIEPEKVRIPKNAEPESSDVPEEATAEAGQGEEESQITEEVSEVTNTENEAEPSVQTEAESGTAQTPEAKQETPKYADGKELTPNQVRGRERVARAIDGLKRLGKALRPMAESLIGSVPLNRAEVKQAMESAGKTVERISRGAKESFSSVVDKGRAIRENYARGVRNRKLQREINSSMRDLDHNDNIIKNVNWEISYTQENMMHIRSRVNERRELAGRFRRRAMEHFNNISLGETETAARPEAAAAARGQAA